MAGNTRGKLKEHLEGVHRNCNAIDTHIQKSVVLIADHNPKLSEGFIALAELTKTLDTFALDIYAQI